MTKILRIGRRNYRVHPTVTYVAVRFSRHLGPVLEFLGPLLAFLGFWIVISTAFEQKYEMNESSGSTPRLESKSVSTPVAPGEGGK